MFTLTDANPGALSKRKVREVRPAELRFLCETFWVEFFRFREVVRVILDSQNRNVYGSARFYGDCSLPGWMRKFVVTDAFPVQKWKYGVLTQCLCDNTRKILICHFAK
jgi:hypothetical protein